MTKDYIVTHNTVLAVAAVVASGAKQTLVIAPKSTLGSAWGATVEMMEAGEVRVIGRGDKAQKEALADFTAGVEGWYATTHAWFTRAYDPKTWNPEAVVVDEVHQIAGPGTSGLKKLVGARATDKKNLAHTARVKLALSGTHSRNKFEWSWGVMRFLWPEQNGAGEIAQTPFSAWQEDRQIPERNYFATSGRSYGGERVPGLLMAQMPCAIKHYQRERCCRFHPKGFLKVAEPTVVEREVELTKSQKSAIKALERGSIAWFKEHPLRAALPIVAQTRIRQSVLAELTITDTDEFDKEGNIVQKVTIDPGAASPMSDEVERLLDEEIDEAEPVLVFTDSRIYAEYLTNRLNERGVSARELSGATSKHRDRDIKEFGKKFKVLVMVIAAAGTGTDGLQRVCATEIWVNEGQTRRRMSRPGLDSIGVGRSVA